MRLIHKAIRDKKTMPVDVMVFIMKSRNLYKRGLGYKPLVSVTISTMANTKPKIVLKPADTISIRKVAPSAGQIILIKESYISGLKKLSIRTYTLSFTYHR
jgi:hypothetical protein